MWITIKGDGNQFHVQIMVRWRSRIALTKAVAAVIASIIVVWPHVQRLGTFFG